MKKNCTKLFVLLAFIACGSTIIAQINAGSPIPVDFVINSPASIAGKYDYAAQTAEWGPTLDHTVTGEMVWAFDECGDSLATEPIVTDLTGKMALIRRGASCGAGTAFFSRKVWHAQEAGAVGAIICNHYDDAAQDGNSLVGMSPATGEPPWDSLALEVTIPAIFVSRNTCEAIQSVVDNGGTAIGSFEVRSFANGTAAYSYHTPQSQIIPLADMGVRFINLDTDTLPELTLTVEITDPNNQTTTISEVVNDIPGQTVLDWIFDTPYTPDAVGEYQVVFSNSENAETLENNFVITDLTFAQDNDDVQVNTDEGWIAPGNQAFSDGGFVYDFGNFYRTGSTPEVATHMSFMLANPDSLYTGDQGADIFSIILYDADPDGNGAVPGDATTYDALNESGGGAVFAGFAIYEMSGQEQPYENLLVEFEDPITLEPNKIYLLMVQYNGIAAATGIPPWYAYGGTHPVAGGLGEAVFTDRFYTGGWSGDWKGVIRMHLDGFVDGTEVPLEKSKISLSPNPATDVVRLNLDLENPAAEVTVRILDFNGRLVRTQQLENVRQGTFSFDVSDLATGNYFMSVTTPEGYRAKKFQVVR